MNQVRLILTFAVLRVAAPSPCAAQSMLGVDSLIVREMTSSHIPGLVAAVVDSGKVVWLGSYGMSDVPTQTVVTDSTPFQIASVSKILTATTLMTLWEGGRFSLDDDINTYLPFSVRNPSHPDVPITFRQLLNHRSSIVDDFDYYGPLWGRHAGDDPTPLGAYLRDYLTPAGGNYSASHFLTVAPDEATAYCNTCYALIGYLAERISGVPFAEFSETVLFQPLGMRETHWFANDFPPDRIASPHRFTPDSGYVAYGQNGYPDWPAGTLRTSIRDLAGFLAAYISRGLVGGRQVIPAAAIEVMAPPDLQSGFLTWWPLGASNGDVLYMHEGQDNGVRTVMAFCPRGGRGVIILTNGASRVIGLAGEIYVRLADTLGRSRCNSGPG